MPSNDTPILSLLASMTADSIDASTLDAQSIGLVRIAALVAIGAPTASYVANLALAEEFSVDAEQVQGVLAAIAPIVGTVRIVAAIGSLAEALGIAIDIAELTEAIQDA